MKLSARLDLTAIVLLGVSIFSSAGLQADVIPAANRIDWTKAGIVGAANPRQLPDTSGWNVIDVTTRGLVGDGKTDNLPAFNALIASLPSPANTVLYFPPGVYYTTGQFSVYQISNLVIRGANDPAKLADRKSVILLHSTDPGSVIKMYSNGGSNVPYYPLANGVAKGQTSVTLANATDAANVTVGQDYYLAENNDPNLVYVYHQGYTGAPNNSGISDGTRCLAQFIHVTAVNGNKVTFEPAAYMDFPLSNNPGIKRQPLVENDGVEDIALTRDVDGGGYPADNGLFFISVYNPWAYNVECYNHDGGGIKLVYCFGGIIRHCYIHDASQTGSGHGYGIWLFTTCSNVLIEDNIVIRQRHAIVYEGGGSGCVAAYNYCDDELESDGPGWVSQSIDTHGSTPYCNLYEGDVTQKACLDSSHGNAIYNTWFRTWARGHATDLSEPYGLSAFDFEYMSRYNAIVGCVAQIPGATGNQFWDTSAGWPNNVSTSYRLGGYSPGVQAPFDAQVPATTVIHRSFDYVSGGETEMNATGLDSALPASLYLSARPSWWNAYVDPATGRPPPWPAIGPDLTPMVSKIPAELRYESAPATVKPSNATTHITVN